MVMFHSCLYVYQRVSNKKTGISHSLAMFFPHEMRNSATSKSDTASKIWATMENEPTEIVINQIAHAITIMSKITCWKRFMLNGIKHSWIHCTGFPRWIRVPRDTKVKTPSAIPTWERTVLSPHCSYGWRGYSNVWDPKCVQYPWLQKKRGQFTPRPKYWKVWWSMVVLLTDPYSKPIMTQASGPHDPHQGAVTTP